MGVDFNAEPSPEGLLLAAQLRREQRQRDKALEDRVVDAQVRDLVAAQVNQDSPFAGLQTSATEPESEAADVIERRAVSAPADYVPAEPDSVPDRVAGPSFMAQLEALASSSRPPRTDRQR